MYEEHHLEAVVMAAVGGNNFIRYIYRGEDGEIIPDEATHIIVGEDVTFVRANAFNWNRNILEVICHDRVETIERAAFIGCWSLRRVIMPGVKIVEAVAFHVCDELTDVECGNRLEIIKEYAFRGTSLRGGINLPSARIVEKHALCSCEALTEVKFGNKLERLKEKVFFGCTSLERITIPLKDGLITANDIFQECSNLMHVDLVEEAELHETIAALQLGEWRNDMYKEIDSINQILPNACAGYYDGEEEKWIVGEKAQAIRWWIRSVLDKIDHYKAEHQHVLNEATALLELAIWKANLDETDESQIVREEGVRTTRGSLKRARRELCITSGASIVIKNVLPFLQLKS